VTSDNYASLGVSNGRYGRSKEINVSLVPDIMNAILK